MRCDDLRAQLDDYVDGGLALPDRAEVEGHLRDCHACAHELARLQALLARARALPRRIEPRRDLWAGIAARLPQAPGAAPPSNGEAGETAPGRGRRRVGAPPSRRWTLAAAAAMLMALSSALTALWLGRWQPVTRFGAERARYARATAELAEQLAAEPRGLSPATLASVQRSLEIVDAAIREAEAALARDPGNPALEQMLVARYEQRLALLARASRLARES